MKDREAAIAAIRTCKTRDSLNDMLKRFEVVEIQEKLDLLYDCMYNPQTFSTSGELTLADELEFTIQIFLTGGWRLNEYYDRMGIGVANTNA